MTIEAIFFKIRNLLLEWSGQLIFLGSIVYTFCARLSHHTTPLDSGMRRNDEVILNDKVIGFATPPLANAV
jgi:hypothetical protein